VDGRGTARRTRTRNPLHGARLRCDFVLTKWVRTEGRLPCRVEFAPGIYAVKLSRKCFEPTRTDKGDLGAMNFPAVHIERIQDLSYTESSPVSFIVAVFSGYFTLGQFRVLPAAATVSARLPLTKLITQGHATARACAQGSIFHLFSRTLYRQMDRTTSVTASVTRLTLFVPALPPRLHLGQPGSTYFETEQDKVSFFCKWGFQDCHRRGLRGSYPTSRQFVISWIIPLFGPSFPECPSTVVTFSYVVLASKGRPTASHLSVYQPLFRQLNCFRFCISRQRSYFSRPKGGFGPSQKAVRIRCNKRNLRYFQIRKKWDNAIHHSVTDDLEFLRDARERFQGKRFEGLYRSWRSGQVGEWCEPKSRGKPERAIFLTPIWSMALVRNLLGMLAWVTGA
jgi:hypothetical protein